MDPCTTVLRCLVTRAFMIRDVGCNVMHVAKWPFLPSSHVFTHISWSVACKRMLLLARGAAVATATRH